MRKLENEEEREALELIKIASTIAKGSRCLRRKCGAMIVKNNRVIGIGFNSQPQDIKLERNENLRCRKTEELEDIKNFKSDKTCCVHAEQRSILSALFLLQETSKIYKSIQDYFKNSAIYFSAIDEIGNPISSGKIYCTICSKMVLDVGIEKWYIWHNKDVYGEEGIYEYNSYEYNEISFENNKHLNQ